MISRLASNLTKKNFGKIFFFFSWPVATVISLEYEASTESQTYISYKEWTGETLATILSNASWEALGTG